MEEHIDEEINEQFEEEINEQFEEQFEEEINENVEDHINENFDINFNDNFDINPLEPIFFYNGNISVLHTLRINERTNFENALYDYLVEPLMLIDDSFWEPVKVYYKDVKELEDIIGEDVCYICTDKHLNFKNLHCCNQKLCNDCCYTWFGSSVKCPYCYQDLREFDLKKIKD